MKLIHIVETIENNDISIEESMKNKYVSRLKITDYITVIAYHDIYKDVYELQVLSAIIHSKYNYHFDTTVKLIDLCSNLLSNLTSDLRESLYNKIMLGEMNKITLILKDNVVSYNLDNRGLLEFKISKQE